MPVAPRMVNDVSYASTMNHDSQSAWQVQHLVGCEADASCSAHCKSHFICNHDHS